jgi:hypothetical protein
LLRLVDLRPVHACWKQGEVEAVPAVIEICVVNFRIDLPLSPSNPEVIRHMARDVRTMPQGLIAPLTQAALASLRARAEGTAASMPEEHRQRLLHLSLIETSPEGDAITALGRERLICDR